MLALLLCSVLGVRSWGHVAHRIIADIAESRLSPHSLARVTFLLDGSRLRDVASWADSVGSDWQWTRKLHYVNAKTCTYDDQRDCPHRQCVVSALTDLALESRAFACGNMRDADLHSLESLKMLVHLLADTNQPLHVSGRSDGGNAAKVMFAGRMMRLHQVWDSGLVEQRARTSNGADQYTRILIETANMTFINSALGPYANLESLWTINSSGNSQLFVDWASESAAIACTEVWTGYDQNTDQDFSRNYYKDRETLVDSLLLISGVRLAAVLETLFGNCQMTLKRKRGTFHYVDVTV